MRLLVQLCLFEETVFLDALSHEVGEGSESFLRKSFDIREGNGIANLPANAANRLIQFLSFQDITFQHQGEQGSGVTAVLSVLRMVGKVKGFSSAERVAK